MYISLKQSQPVDRQNTALVRFVERESWVQLPRTALSIARYAEVVPLTA